MSGCRGGEVWAHGLCAAPAAAAVSELNLTLGLGFENGALFRTAGGTGILYCMGEREERLTRAFHVGLSSV